MSTHLRDTTDPLIEFDDDGRCNHRRDFEGLRGTVWFPNAEGARMLECIIDRVRRAGAGNEYDSMHGIRGGVDSSCLAIQAHEWGLRPLVVHIDDGWNSDLAVQAIEAV